MNKIPSKVTENKKLSVTKLKYVPLLLIIFAVTCQDFHLSLSYFYTYIKDDIVHFLINDLLPIFNNNLLLQSYH